MQSGCFLTLGPLLYIYINYIWESELTSWMKYTFAPTYKPIRTTARTAAFIPEKEKLKNKHQKATFVLYNTVVMSRVKLNV